MYTSERISTEERYNLQALKGYIIATCFCALFFFIYDQFSHNVRSVYMTYLWAWPLVLGVVPSLVFQFVRKFPWPNLRTRNIYRCGVEALTFSSALHGVFDIAGNASDYQTYMMMAGFALLAAGIFSYVLQRHFHI